MVTGDAFLQASSLSSSFVEFPSLTVALSRYLLVSFVFLTFVKLLYSFYSDSAPKGFNFVPFSREHDVEDTVITDCTHPQCYTLSHHKGHSNPEGLEEADTSTGLVLNALAASYFWSYHVYSICQKPNISTNHFDIDSLLSVWCYINREVALQHEGVLRHAARIGDYREAFLSPELLNDFGAEDHISSMKEALTALKVCCWMNTTERRLFSAPYEEKDCNDKFEYFLPRFGEVLVDPEAYWEDWQEEYTQVLSGFDHLSGPDACVLKYDDIGLVVIYTPEPLHYYSLFSHTVGYDIVLTLYDENCYELECKYTQYTEVTSRPVWPRLDLGPLAALLNQVEAVDVAAEGVMWMAKRFTDTGPLLRMDRVGNPLTKAQRYGHPMDRPFFPSTIPPSKMQALVQSYLEFGLRALDPRVGGWAWEELHDLNQEIPWPEWSACCLEQNEKGELDQELEQGPVWLYMQHKRTSASQHVSRANSEDMGPAAGLSQNSTALAVVPEETSGMAGPSMSEQSHILTEAHVKILSGAVPPYYQHSRWRLVYATYRDGISLQTLLRKAHGLAPTIVVVKDTKGHVLGAYSPEPWRVAPRFYSTGETFVFQLEPIQAVHMWKKPNLPAGEQRNDYFVYSNYRCLAVGGSGHWAMWLDSDLQRGTSGYCETFASPCLASEEEFEVLVVELWHLS